MFPALDPKRHRRASGQREKGCVYGGEGHLTEAGTFRAQGAGGSPAGAGQNSPMSSLASFSSLPSASGTPHWPSAS